MKAILVIDNPQNVEATISLTLPLKDWKRLREQLKAYEYPSHDIIDAIDDLTRQAETRFYPKPPKEQSS